MWMLTRSIRSSALPPHISSKYPHPCNLPSQPPNICTSVSSHQADNVDTYSLVRSVLCQHRLALAERPSPLRPGHMSTGAPNEWRRDRLPTTDHPNLCCPAHDRLPKHLLPDHQPLRSLHDLQPLRSLRSSLRHLRTWLLLPNPRKSRHLLLHLHRPGQLRLGHIPDRDRRSRRDHQLRCTTTQWPL